MPLARGTSCPWPGQLQEMILEMVVLVISCCPAPVLNHSDTGSRIPLVTQDFDPISTHSGARRCS